MKQLIVSLEYTTADFGRRRGPDAGLALPVKVLDVDGSVLTEGVASVDMPATLELPVSTELVFVRLTWPSGRTETQRINLQNESSTTMTFSDSHISSNEWSAWAIPKLNPRTPLAMATNEVDLGLDRFARVWLRLWKFEQGEWIKEKLKPETTYRNRAVWQLDLYLDERPWLLQIGGSKVIWRFLSLPGGGPARVLITPKDSKDPRADELKVIVTSFRADAETLLEFIARDAMREADSLANSATLAKHLVADKFIDPVSAVAGAYYLLRVEAWNRVPRQWFENLSQQFHWLPDAAIVHCIRLLREGCDAWAEGLTPHILFAQSLERGWPVYSEGILLLQEAASSLRDEFAQSEPLLFERAQALGAAKAWAGAVASFYGRSPDTPSTLQWVGMPRAPRRRRLDPALKKSRPADSISEKRLAAESPSRIEEDRDLTGLITRVGVAPLFSKRKESDDEEFLLGSIT